VPNAPQAGLPNTTWEAATGNESEALKTAYQLMGARVYIPALGRFAQLDPRVGGSANGYDYANQDPVNYSDPSGNATDTGMANIFTGLASFATGLIAGLFTRSATVGALVGAITGAAVTGISHAIEFWVTGQTEFSATRLGISILAGAFGGGIGGRVKWAKAQNSSSGNVNRVSTTIDDGKQSVAQKFVRPDSPTTNVRARPPAELPIAGSPQRSSLDLEGMLQQGKRPLSFVSDKMNASAQSLGSRPPSSANGWFSISGSALDGGDSFYRPGSIPRSIRGSFEAN
jgi:RHS repeat-associated protein